MPKCEAIKQFAASMHLVLDFADKYPRDSLPAHILDVVEQFSPALLTPCSRRGRVRQTVSNAKRFQRGEWKGALSKANQAITSDLLPNSDPLNIDHLRLKHPEPAHPDRDPVCVRSIL